MTVHCPACKAEVIVPTIRNLAKLPVIEPETTDASVSRGKPSGSNWSLPLGIFAAFSFLILCATWGWAGLIVMDRYQKRDAVNELERWGVEQELDHGDEMVSKYSYADLWDVWDSYRTEGLGTKKPPEFIMAKEAFDDNKKLMYLLFSVGGVALLGVVAAAYLGRRKA